MTYDAREKSQYSGQPYELYLFQTQTEAWRLTSADRSIVYLGNTYDPEAIKRTDISQGAEVKGGEVKITLPKTHPVALLFVAYLPVSDVDVVIYRGHEGDSEVVVNFTGFVNSAAFGDFCDLSCLPEQYRLKSRCPSMTYQKTCNHITYGPGCGVDKELFRLTGTLTAVSGAVITAAEFATKPDGWFTAGYIEKGFERRMILSHVGQNLTLISPMAGLMAGDVVSAYAGDKRTYSECVNKFSNGPKFFGLGHMIPKKNPFRGLEY